MTSYYEELSWGFQNRAQGAANIAEHHYSGFLPSSMNQTSCYNHIAGEGLQNL